MKLQLQVVNEEDNNQSENPGLESAGSKQPQENIDKGKNIMNNEKASIEEAIDNDYRVGKMSRDKKSTKQKMSRNKNSTEQKLLNAIYIPETMESYLKRNNIKDEPILKSIIDKVNAEIQKKKEKNIINPGPTKKQKCIDQRNTLLKTRDFLEKKIKSIGTDAKAAVSSVTDVSATTSSHEAPVNIDDEKKQAHAQPAEHVPEESAKLKAQPSNTQEQQEVSETPVPEQTDDIESLSTQDALVPQSKSATVLSVDSDEEKQASLSDEVFYDAKESMLGTTNSKDGSTLEGDSDKQESQPKSVPTPLVANEISEQKDGTQTSTRQQEVFPFYPYMQNGHVLPSGSLNPITEMGNTQNLQSAVLSSQQLAFRNVIEIFNKHGREGFTSLKLVVQEFLRNGISEIQLPTSNGYITLNLNTINKAGSEGLQNIEKVLTDSYENGALNDRTRNAIETHDDIDDYRLFSEKDPTLTPTPVPTPNPILTSIPGEVPTSVPPVTSESSATLNSPQPSVANNKSEQVNDAQTTTKQLEEPISPSVPPTVHVSQNNIHVQPSNSTPTATATRSSTPTTQVVPKNVPAAPVPPVTSESSGQADNVQINGKQSTNPSNIANASSDVNSKPITKEPVVTESNQQNSLPPLSSFDLSSPQRFVDDKVSSITGVLRSEVSIEDNTSSLDITDDEYSEDSSIISEDSLIEDVTDEKEPLLDKINKGDSTLKSSNSPQSTKSSKLPVIAASALAIAGIISGVAVAVYLEMLAVGIAVGACCLVAAVIIYCCNRPSSSFKGSNVELIADEELTAQQTVN
ncbi:TomO hydrophobic C-terminal domain-containing protein [Wolbachia endosymbiont (group A) of Cheilosia soror]|uniref:TomO hydrophobic C-terminal domain-containing protein n=1 Tax=Wolbachia endosymbiont (group A) of Cheilosia soror TaxID=2953995 RepID=UPI0021F8ED2C|nr:hypothetical protein [Wolbachia endosymbiont (group A) of Cheilosia soror]